MAQKAAQSKKETKHGYEWLCDRSDGEGPESGRWSDVDIQKQFYFCLGVREGCVEVEAFELNLEYQ